MRVRFWGVRGALAATSPDAQEVGGNTVCVEVRDADDTLLVLDAGMGLYWLGRKLLAGPHGRGQGKVTLLLSHSHWDHIQGFPFFVPGFIPGNELDVWGGGAAQFEEILERQLNPTYSPIVSLDNMGAQLAFSDLRPGERPQVGRLRVAHATFPNGAQQIVGYRLEEDERALCYIPEVEHTGGELNPAVLELARGAQVLIHEAYYTNEELAAGGTSLVGAEGPGSQGHASFRQATEVALAAGSERLFYFYHHPDHDDACIDGAVAEEARYVASRGADLRVEAAREGFDFEV